MIPRRHDDPRVAEWTSILQTLEDAGRHPARTPEARRLKAVDLARSDERLRSLRSDARVVASLSDDERARLRAFSDCAPRPYPSKQP